MGTAYVFGSIAHVPPEAKERDVQYTAMPLGEVQQGIVNLPSMSLEQAAQFMRIAGEYNRGLINETEMNTSLTLLGLSTPDDVYIFQRGWNEGCRIALEPYYHASVPGAIKFRVRLVRYAS
jgi:hypothetical protein